MEEHELITLLAQAFAHSDWKPHSPDGKFQEEIDFLESAFDLSNYDPDGFDYFKRNQNIGLFWSAEIPQMQDAEFLYVFPRLLAFFVWSYPSDTETGGLLWHLDVESVERWMPEEAVDIFRRACSGRVASLIGDQREAVARWMEFFRELSLQEGEEEMFDRADRILTGLRS